MVRKIGMQCVRLAVVVVLAVFALITTHAQQTLGSINGTVTDSSGAVVQQASVSARNIGTNLVVTAQTKDDGSFSIIDLPIGTYEVTITKSGFEKAVYSQIAVQGSLTSTVKASLQPGEVTTSITVEATPLLNETDTSNGYTLGTDVIQSTPLGTGSFTQLAILAPGTSADLLSGSGSNEGLGNQGIVANGQSDNSNSFTFNSVNADNLFNGNSTSNVSDSRFTLNTGEIFGAGGQVQTNTSVNDAIGEGLPTPAVESIQELHVVTSMYDASMGQNSGAQIELTTMSGSNQYHGQGYEYFQNNGLDAAPTFLTPNAFFSGAPPLHRDVFGGTLGGPIKKDKLFFFGSYQRQHVSDALNGAFSGVPTIAGLSATNRDPADLANLVNFNQGLASTLGGTCTSSKCITAAQVDPVALKLLTAKVGSQFLIPDSGVGLLSGVQGEESSSQKYNSAIVGPPSTFLANQVNANLDYVFSPSDRLSEKYYFQRNPTTSPFAVSGVLGFPQSLQAGSQVLSIDNTSVMSPNTTWEQRIGFIRQTANATTGQALTPASIGISLPNANYFPGFSISNADAHAPLAAGGFVSPTKGDSMRIGPSSNFANAGIFQNQFEGASKYNWVLGRNTISFGGTFDYGQLNVENRENDVATFTFNNIADFVTGKLNTDKSGGTFLDGETNRHFRSKQAGLYIQDDMKVTPTLGVNFGLRWDWDGPLYETNGLLTNFNAKDYGYNLATDSFSQVNGTPGIGIVVAGNNAAFGTKGVSNSTLTGRQWSFAPRVGLVWSPKKDVVVRSAFGLFSNRGEYFTELSPTAGSGISGPFGVTTEQPFTIKCSADIPTASCSTGCTTTLNCLSSAPFGTTLTPPPTSLAGIAALVPDMRQMADCAGTAVPGLEQPNQPWCTVATTGTTVEPFIFGGYNPTNKLPYSEDWSLDLQWQPMNDLVLTLGYTGNHGLHEVLPIPFNQPGIATPGSQINNQIYSYGYLAAGGSGCDDFNDASSTCFQLPAETVQTNLNGFAFSDGNTALRSKYIGLNPNAVLWTAEGISNYDALELGVTKKVSHGLQVTASYTYSHSLDEGSGIGAGYFYNGNNPSRPGSSYSSSDFDRTHVFIVSYLYSLPTIKNASRLVDTIANGWGVTGVTTAQSGEPFSIIDFSGVAGSLYYSGGDDEVTNPILPLAPGISPQKATLGNTDQKAVVPGTSTTPPTLYSLPYVNPDAFAEPNVAPGVEGVPPCELVNTVNVCDNYETGFGSTGRNAFRAPFETLFDFSIFKNFTLTERFKLKFEADAFNLFNHPDFDSPDSDFELNPCFNPVPCYNFTPLNVNATPPVTNSKGYGVIDGTVGSSRFLQLSLHLTF
jgi:hypothetical protein